MSTRTLRNALVLVSVLAAACKTGPSTTVYNRKPSSLAYRMDKHFLGYRHGLDGKYIDFQQQKKKDINKTLRRHFLNNDPDSPFLEDPSQTSRRAPHSLLPDPMGYLHAEGIVWGVTSSLSSGTFVPIPPDAVFATVFGGRESWKEFGQGIANTFTGKRGGEGRTPPSTREFRVKNR